MRKSWWFLPRIRLLCWLLTDNVQIVIYLRFSLVLNAYTTYIHASQSCADWRLITLAMLYLHTHSEWPLLPLHVCVSWTITGQPRNSDFIRGNKPPFKFCQGTGFDNVGRRLGLTTRTQISVCKSPFPSAGTAVSLFHAKTVQQRPLLPREVETMLPDFWVTH